ncbi:MAG: DUF2232 domain-containing protein [Nitrospinae bacterium]|nr:DUF2232 domain-containing protein [Nitrospinota bacterium]
MTETIAKAPLPYRVILGRVAAPALSAGLFLSLFYVPVLGGLLNPFSPLPIIYAFFRFGQTAAVAGTFFSALVVALVTDPRLAVFYFLSYGAMALVMSKYISRRAGLNKVVMTATLVSLTGTALFFAFAVGGQFGGLFNELTKAAQLMLAEVVNTYKKAGIQEEQLAYLVNNTPAIAKWIVNIIPGLTITCYLMFGIVNYASFKAVRARWPFLQDGEDTENLASWYPPDSMVYLFIAGLAMTLYPGETSRIFGVNLLLVTSLVYSVAGIYIVQYLFEKIRFPKFLRVIVYLLILLQPFVALAVAIAGLFDLWFDFRKVRRPAGVKEENKWT